VYGIDDIRTAVGYFHLGKVFHELNRDDIAEPMFDMVIHRASNDRCLKLGRHCPCSRAVNGCNFGHPCSPAVFALIGVDRVWYEEGAQNYVKIFVAHKMTRNNTLNKVRIAATGLPQLLSQNRAYSYKYTGGGETTAERRRQALCGSKVN